jgi:CRP/FNR family transcriptional regulator, cyclic AMP receptor protein
MRHLVAVAQWALSARPVSNAGRACVAVYDSDVDGENQDPKLALLKGVPLFAGLGTDALEAIGQITEERDVEAGTALTTEGRHEGYFFVIVSGSVRIERGGHAITTLRDGDFLGEIALLDGGPRTATAIAETDSQLLVMTYQRFQQLLETEPGVRTAILEEVARRLRELDADAGY